MSEVEVEKNIPEGNEVIATATAAPKEETTPAPEAPKKACLLYDGTEDSAYMCVRMARDKDFELCVCVPKFKEGKENKQWNDVKNVIQKEDNQTKFHNLTSKADDLEGCCIECANFMKKEKTVFLFVGWAGERFQDSSQIYRQLFNSLPTKFDEIAGKDTILRIGFPYHAMSIDTMTQNRQNLGLDKIFGQNTKPKKEEE